MRRAIRYLVFMAGNAISDQALDDAIMRAHDDNNAGLLAALYTEAADRIEAAGQQDAACFLLTQAYIFALDAGGTNAQELHRRLVAYGREE